MAAPSPQPSGSPAVAPPPEPAWLLVIPIATTALIEVLLLYAVAAGRVGIGGMLLSHGVIVVLLGLWLRQLARAGRNIVMPLLATVAVAAAGPAGACAMLAVRLVSRRREETPELLRDWYDRIAMAVETDETTRLSEKITTGRTVALTGRAPASFAAVIEHGALSDRQAALGVIARNFHPDYLPVLTLALKSTEPVIRVQAAAVATHIRGDLRRLVDQLVLGKPGADTPPPLEAVRQLELAVASGLLDEGDRIRASAVAERLRQQSRAGAVSLRPPPVLERDAIEGALIHQRRFAELRVARRIAAVTASGLARVRRIRPAARRREAA